MFKILTYFSAIAFSLSAPHSALAEQPWSHEDLMQLKRQAQELQSKPVGGPAWSYTELQKLSSDAKQIQNDALKSGMDVPMTPGMQSKLSRHYMKETEELIPKLMNKDAIRPESYAGPGKMVPEDHRMEVFISMSMPKRELREIFLEAAGNPSVRILYRGVPEGMSIPQALRLIKEQIGDLESPPDIRIDPKAFREHGVQYVPQIILYERTEEGERVASHVKGISNLSTAVDVMLDQGETPRTRGPVVRVKEPDLIEYMAKKLQNMDFAAMKRESVNNYWNKVRFYQLEEATSERIRRLDPTVTVSQPIVDHNGRTLIQANKKFNPLQMRKFTHRMIVFDGTDPAQAQMAAQLAETTPAHLKPMLITTSLDREKGWYALKSLEEQMDRTVFLLTPDIISRWKLEKVPVFVEAENEHFIIHEVPAREGGA